MAVPWCGSSRKALAGLRRLAPTVKRSCGICWGSVTSLSQQKTAGWVLRLVVEIQALEADWWVYMLIRLRHELGDCIPPLNGSAGIWGPGRWQQPAISWHACDSLAYGQSVPLKVVGLDWVVGNPDFIKCETLNKLLYILSFIFLMCKIGIIKIPTNTLL